MTKYLWSEPFSVPLGGKAFGDGWDRTFGKKAEEDEHTFTVPYELALPPENPTHAPVVHFENELPADPDARRAVLKTMVETGLLTEDEAAKLA